MAARETLSRTLKGPDRLIGWAAGLVLVLHLVAISLPAMQIDRLLIFSDEVSIVGAILRLFQESEIFIGLVLFVFTIVFPVLKLVAVIHVFARAPLDHPKLPRRLSQLEGLGKWSMLDVFVAALLVVSITASGLAEARFKPGLYLFAFTVIATLALSSRLSTLVRRHGRHGTSL